MYVTFRFFFYFANEIYLPVVIPSTANQRLRTLKDLEGRDGRKCVLTCVDL